MGETFRVSVRELVAFSYFPEDILPASDATRMLMGAQAHRARQAHAQGQAEQSVKRTFAAEDASVLVYGRMDLYVDGETPLVEEIKLGTGEGGAPLPEHRAQAVCYAAIVAHSKPCRQVRICVTYVDEQGAVRARFEETQDAEVLDREVYALLAPYIAFAKREAQHRRTRDQSLQQLGFPFPSYRQGQRELAAQVYTAITRRKRLFASLPTGTGKSAAVLFPALKAMGEGRTGKVVYLTARGSARQSPINTLKSLYEQGMRARCTVLTAKEKLCPAPTRCHPDHCSRAKGHFLRQDGAVAELLSIDDVPWTDAQIMRIAEKHDVCPFELALKLCELADVALMDVNYAFDPFAQNKRLFQRRDITLLVDEAHHAVERVRESLSGSLDSRMFRQLRASHGKRVGRANSYYRALTQLIQRLEALDAEGDELPALPEGVLEAAQGVLMEATAQISQGAGMTSEAADAIRLCLAFQYAALHLDEDYAILLERHGKGRLLTLYCLLPGKEIARITKPLRGTVFFSATLTPLPAMKQLLGGGEADACFALPSPFEPSRLAVVRKRVDTRYAAREGSAAQVAAAIREMALSRAGSYIVYFPSYAYLEMVLALLQTDGLPPLHVQRRDMDEHAREAFLHAFENEDGAPKLGLCVLGGMFSEGIDLPGARLIGAMVVGVGLPTPSGKLAAVQRCYEHHFGDGFAYACRIPAMHKVLQAAGRVIRSETDTGMVVLVDTRYFDPVYEALLPGEWQLMDEDISRAAARLEGIACAERGNEP